MNTTFLDPISNPNDFISNDDPLTELKTENSKIHIRIRQRNRRQTITTIEHMPSDLDLTKILKPMRKTFSCNGNIGETNGLKYIQLSGDQRIAVKQFLIKKSIAPESNIIIHGF
jgi:translation initiation factor 1